MHIVVKLKEHITSQGDAEFNAENLSIHSNQKVLVCHGLKEIDFSNCGKKKNHRWKDTKYSLD